MPDLSQIIQNLEVSSGRDFEKSVAEAFSSLNFDAKIIEETDAESDVIVEALYAENPYYIVIECCAVEPQNQVQYTKIGQLRSNFTKYMDERRQRIFKNAYKLVVGKPEFSDNAKQRSLPDVGLLTVSFLKLLVKLNSAYHFSQDELEKLVSSKGEIRGVNILPLVQPFYRKVSIYSLVFISLMENPFPSNQNSRKQFTPIDQIIGEVKVLAALLKMQTVTDEEIKNAVRDLCSPFPALVVTRENSLKLASHPFELLTSLGGLWEVLSQEIKRHLETFERMQTSHAIT
jgi:hypothetical protein